MPETAAPSAVETLKNGKWLIGLIAALIIPISGFHIKVVGDIAAMRTSFEATEKNIESLDGSLNNLSRALSELVRTDLTDIKQRLAVMENKQILPSAQRQIDALEEDMKELRQQMATR